MTDSCARRVAASRRTGVAECVAEGRTEHPDFPVKPPGCIIPFVIVSERAAGLPAGCVRDFSPTFASLRLHGFHPAGVHTGARAPHVGPEPVEEACV